MSLKIYNDKTDSWDVYTPNDIQLDKIWTELLKQGIPAKRTKDGIIIDDQQMAAADAAKTTVLK